MVGFGWIVLGMCVMICGLKPMQAADVVPDTSADGHVVKSDIPFTMKFMRMSDGERRALITQLARLYRQELKSAPGSDNTEPVAGSLVHVNAQEEDVDLNKDAPSFGYDGLSTFSADVHRQKPLVVASKWDTGEVNKRRAGGKLCWSSICVMCRQ